MPITFSLRSVAWLGIDPAKLKNPSGSPAPRHSAPLVYDDIRHWTGVATHAPDPNEIQYLVHGCPQVSMVTAAKGESNVGTVHGPAGEVLYQRCNGADDGFPTTLSEDQYDAVHEVYTTFATERAAGRLR